MDFSRLLKVMLVLSIVIEKNTLQPLCLGKLTSTKSPTFKTLTTKTEENDDDDYGIVVCASYQTSSKCIQALDQLLFEMFLLSSGSKSLTVAKKE